VRKAGRPRHLGHGGGGGGRHEHLTRVLQSHAPQVFQRRAAGAQERPLHGALRYAGPLGEFGHPHRTVRPSGEPGLQGLDVAVIAWRPALKRGAAPRVDEHIEQLILQSLDRLRHGGPPIPGREPLQRGQ
jgi:hypothetical protein